MNKIKKSLLTLITFSLLLGSQGLLPLFASAAEDGLSSNNMFENGNEETPLSLDERIEALESSIGIETSSQEEEIEASTLEEQIQELKGEILELNRELALLEQDILTPVSSQTALFLSLNKGHFLKLDGLKLKIDGNVVQHHLYTRQEIEALKKGAIQRVYTGNLAPGNHELVLVLSGYTIDGRDVKRAAEYSFYKPNSKKYIELAIKDNTATQKVDFEFKEWD